MKLKRRANGFYYIYLDRLNRKSLKTRDPLEAKKLFAIEKENVRQGKVVEFEKINRIRLSEFLTEYIEGNSELPKREHYATKETIYNDENAFAKFISFIGDLPLRLVKQKHVDEFKCRCLALNYTKTYINILLRSLRAAFNAAVLSGYIPENIFQKKRFKQSVLFELDAELPKYLTIEEIQAFFEAIDNPDFRIAAAIYIYTGMRRNELVKLNAQDVDLTTNTIKIRHTKSKRDREVPINEHLREILVAGLKTDIGPLFPRWRRADTMSHLFRKYADKAGIKLTLHSLRHSYGTHLRLNGEQLDVIQKLMGHSDIKTTMIYAKVVDETLRQATNKLKFKI